MFPKVKNRLIFAAALAVKKGGAVAQLVEQRTENPCVGGSIPPHTTLKKTQLRLGLFVYKNATSYAQQDTSLNNLMAYGRKKHPADYS